jgi:Cdc6-like AAA superfamily ATPase
MAKIKNIEELREAIRDLEHQDYVNQQHMRRKVSDIADRLKPMNIIKNLFSQVVGRSEKKVSLFRIVAGVATSFLVKKFLRKGIASK